MLQLLHALGSQVNWQKRDVGVHAFVRRMGANEAGLREKARIFTRQTSSDPKCATRLGADDTHKHPQRAERDILRDGTALNSVTPHPAFYHHLPRLEQGVLVDQIRELAHGT